MLARFKARRGRGHYRQAFLVQDSVLPDCLPTASTLTCFVHTTAGNSRPEGPLDGRMDIQTEACTHWLVAVRWVPLVLFCCKQMAGRQSLTEPLARAEEFRPLLQAWVGGGGGGPAGGGPPLPGGGGGGRGRGKGGRKGGGRGRGKGKGEGVGPRGAPCGIPRARRQETRPISWRGGGSGRSWRLRSTPPCCATTCLLLDGRGPGAYPRGFADLILARGALCTSGLEPMGTR